MRPALDRVRGNHVRIDVQGDRIRVWYDGKPVCDVTEPSLLVAQCLFYGYVVTRMLHFAAYATARTHDLRAMLWTPGSLIIVFMAGRTLVFAALRV